MARQEYYQDGQLIRVEDTRTLSEAIEERKAVWADETTKLIRTKVTETDERNCANGIYQGEKKAQILGWINECRNKYLACKATAITCTKNEEIDSIRYDVGTNLDSGNTQPENA
jgi:thymidine phosphorylase